MAKITCVVGARPNFIKIAAIVRELKQRPRFSPRLVHTGQHYSPEMSESFFQDLELPRPDINLGVSGSSHTEQTARIMLALEQELQVNRPDLAMVVGDVNSTMAAALVASKLSIPIAHVEAGLRSFDRSMPEEINRLVTDVLSDFLFASEPSGVENLIAEGIPRSKIHFVGNVMIDTLLYFRAKSATSDVLERHELKPKSYAVVTLHRPSNVDDATRLAALLEMLEALAEHIAVVFPVHPRTRARVPAGKGFRNGLRLCPPLGYLDFLRLMSDARLVLTDSGGIQEETTILRVPCLTLRDNTERPVTIHQGTNRLAGTEPKGIFEAALRAIAEEPAEGPAPELWDGGASRRILDVLEQLP
jgi:UDP-N-acetylglucosamine 2-epimerase (non-hydrolysing)